MPNKKNKKPTKKQGDKANRTTINKKRKRKQTYATYIHKVLKNVNPDQSISSKSVDILNNFTNDMFERIATEASCLVRRNNRVTITNREIQSAVCILLPNQLGNYISHEAMKAMAAYNSKKTTKTEASPPPPPQPQ